MSSIARPPCDEAVIRATPARTPCSRASEIWILTATILGSSLAFVDGTVVNVALPALQAEFGATGTAVQWVVEAYSLFLASLLLVGGSLGDRYGRRRVYAMGVILFAAASTWCGMVGTMAELIVARAVQGVGAALLVPGSLAIISASFDESSRGRAIGTWSGFTGITSALGPVIGGWFIEHVSWRWVFFINLPIAVIVVVIVLWRLPESRDEESAAGAPLDWMGAVLATIALAGLVFGFIESSSRGWGDAAVIGAFAAGVVALAAFVAVERRHPAPMLPLTLFASTNFTGANLLTLLLYAALGGAFYFFPFNLVQLQRYTPTAAGAGMLPLILIMFVLSRWAGGLVARTGARLPLMAGPLIAAVGFALFARPGIGGSYWTTFFPAVVVLGFGLTITVAPLTTTVMGSVERRHAGIASGINNAVSRTAGLLAIALMGIVLTVVFNRELDRELARMELSVEARQAVDTQRARLAGAEIPRELPEPTRAQLRRTIDEAFVQGFRTVMLVASALSVLASLVAWRTIDRQGDGRSASPRSPLPQGGG